MLILSYLLTIVLTSTVMSIYGYPLWSWMTIVIMISALVTYGFCYFVEKHAVMGKFVMIGFLLLWGYAVGLCWRVGQGQCEIYFWQWVLTGGDEAKEIVAYAIALEIAAVGFLGMTAYYFSKALYRIHFLTLVSLLPCVLYVKVVAEVDNFYLILIAGLNLAICICKRQEEAGGRWAKGKKAVAGSVLCFASIVLFMAAVIPKEKDAKYYDQFEDLFLQGDTTSELSGDFSSLGDFSGNADNFRGGSNRRLYTIYGKGFEYLKRQNFDIYDFEKDRWQESKEFRQRVYSPKNWDNYSSKLQLSQLQLALKRAIGYDSEFAQRYGLTEVVEGQTIMDPINNFYVRSENFGAFYYLMPSRGIRVQINDSAPYMVSRSGSFYRTESVHDKNETYQIFFGDSFEIPGQWIQMGGADFDSETAEQMLEELVEILNKNGDRYEQTARAYLTQQMEARKYREAVADNTEKISKQLRELAHRITENKKYDWEKAYALQQYFQEGNFIYDLTYRDKDTSPEHFLLESKTGTCSDFASAYVLLARAAGLTVRYAEGYVPEKMLQQASYEVTEANSHAYPEVFIQNIGWLIFEPTVAGTAGQEKTDLLAVLGKLEMDYGLILVLAMFAGAGILVLAFIRLLIPWIGEGVFRIRLKRATSEKAAIMAYQRLFQWVHKEEGEAVSGMTPKEFADYALEMKGWDIGDMISVVECVSYQEGVVEQEAAKDIYDIYRRVRKQKTTLTST